MLLVVMVAPITNSPASSRARTGLRQDGLFGSLMGFACMGQVGILRAGCQPAPAWRRLPIGAQVSNLPHKDANVINVVSDWTLGLVGACQVYMDLLGIGSPAWTGTIFASTKRKA